MPALRRGPNAYDLPQEDPGIPIDQLADVLPSREPLPPEVAAMARSGPQDELRAAQKESDLLRFLSTQGRGFDEAGRIIAGIPGAMQIDLAGTDKPVQHVQQRMDEQFRQDQFKDKKRLEEEAKKERARLEAKADKQRQEDIAREQEDKRLGRQTTLQAAALHGRGQAEARQAQAANEINERTVGLRKEAESNPYIKDFKQKTTYLDGLRQAAKDPSPQGDLLIIFNYMKMLDPGVSVMEGDVENARKTASIPDQVWGLFERARGGGSMAPGQRAGFLRQAEKILGDAEARANEAVDFYRGEARKAGVDETSVVFLPRKTGAGPAPRAQAGPAKGFVRVQTSDGQTADIPSANLKALQADDPGVKILADGG